MAGGGLQVKRKEKKRKTMIAIAMTIITNKYGLLIIIQTKSHKRIGIPFCTPYPHPRGHPESTLGAQLEHLPDPSSVFSG